MDYRSQFPLWFFVGALLAGGITALIAALRSALNGLGEAASPGWGMMLIENAPAATLGLAGVLVLGLLGCWRLSRR